MSLEPIDLSGPGDPSFVRSRHFRNDAPPVMQNAALNKADILGSLSSSSMHGALEGEKAHASLTHGTAAMFALRGEVGPLERLQAGERDSSERKQIAWLVAACVLAGLLAFVVFQLASIFVRASRVSREQPRCPLCKSPFPTWCVVIAASLCPR